MAWKEIQVSVIVIGKHFQFMHLHILDHSGREWFFTLVYTSLIHEMQGLLWQELKNIAYSMGGQWLVVGDFNDISCQSEKKGVDPVSQRRSNLLLDRINDCQLMDLGVVGPKFTWRGPLYNGVTCSFEHLDRALCNEGWRLGFLEAVVRVAGVLMYQLTRIFRMWRTSSSIGMSMCLGVIGNVRKIFWLGLGAFQRSIMMEV